MPGSQPRVSNEMKIGYKEVGRVSIRAVFGGIAPEGEGRIPPYTFALCCASQISESRARGVNSG